jgi:hypothetical protein
MDSRMMNFDSKDFQKSEISDIIGKVLLPDKDVLDIIIDRADLQDMTLLLNLAWFLTNQI